jgi:hypothetical protein
MRAHTLAIAATLLTTACTGLSLGENNPGGDTYLGNGSLAVDDRTEKAFILNKYSGKEFEDTSLLRSVDPDSGLVSEVADLSGRNDERILFPASGILVMSEKEGKDELLLLDKDTFAEKQREPIDVRYHGTRMSPSRDWIAVADNTSTTAPIHIIDSAILTRRIIPHNGDWLEAMWMNQSDELFAIVFYNMFEDGSDPAAKPYARILSWSMADVKAGEFQPDAEGFWPDRKLDITVPNVSGDLFFSFTWVGISPDDKWAVFPVIETDPNTPEDHALLVVDTATGDLRVVPDAKGPVGFTPDSSTIVSYDDNGSQNGPDGRTPDDEVDQRLLLIDVNTLEIDPQDVDISGGISYFISRDGNFVVVASSNGDEKLVFHDLDNDTTSQMAGPAIGLDEFVSRRGHNELWLVDEPALFKIDMNAGELSQIEPGYGVQHIHILPEHDWLVVSDVPASGSEVPRLHFFDPVALKDVKAVEMPPPPSAP